MPDIVLLVFEGAKTERQVFTNLKKHFFKGQNSIIYATFDADIYQLWNKVKDDEFLDLLEIIRERHAQNKSDLNGISRDSVSQIFLFFDYDGHATNASDDAIAQMLTHFDNETVNGKLYISYPMVEALKHIEQDVDFKDITVNAKSKTACDTKQMPYKQLVGSVSCYQDFTKFTLDVWRHIILENYKKAHFIVNGTWVKPRYHETDNLNQSVIFDSQLNKFISVTQKVAVLSAFPFFIIEYFGESTFNELEETE